MVSCCLPPLTKEALPVIRYRTRDLTRLLPGTAPDHAPHGSHQRTQRRYADYPRVNVFPSQLEEEILKFEHLAPHYQLEESIAAVIWIRWRCALS